MPLDGPVTLTEIIGELRRLVSTRRDAWSELVEEGHMSQHIATRRIACVEAAIIYLMRFGDGQEITRGQQELSQ